MKLRLLPTVLAVMTATVLTPAAQAVSLSPDGLGQVLIYPYYTVNANNATLLSIVNTKPRGKVLRVRFLEGYNGQEVVDFVLFLSAFDVWTGNVFALDASAGGLLLTDDESCTIPDFKGAVGPGLGQLPAPDGRTYVFFRAGQYQTDGGPKTLDRTREGSIEVVELAGISAGSAIETAITHVDGVPPGCTGLISVVSAHQDDLGGPTGGLFGSASIVNPALGTLIGYNADAIDGFNQLGASLYNFCCSSFLALARTTVTTAVAYNSVATTADGPNNLVASTYSSTNAIDAVSSIFTASAIANEYVIESNSASESEWVVSFPTKRSYINSTPVIPPFVERFAAPGRSCVRVSVEYFNREREPAGPIDDFSAGTPRPPSVLCYQTQVVSFLPAADYTANPVSAVLGSKLTMNVDPRSSDHFSSGWLRLGLNPSGGAPDFVTELHALRPSIDGDVFKGLPVTGFLATNYLNRNNGGPNILSTYSTGSRHRAVRECVNTTVGGSGSCD